MTEPGYHGAMPDDAKLLCVVGHGRGQIQQKMMSLMVERIRTDMFVRHPHNVTDIEIGIVSGMLHALAVKPSAFGGAVK